MNYDTTMFALKELLNKVPMDKDFLRLHPILFGKIIKGYPIKSKFTLTNSEIHLFKNALEYAYKHWTTEGHNDWLVTEIPGIQFTVKFIRKGSEEEKRFRLNGGKHGT